MWVVREWQGVSLLLVVVVVVGVVVAQDTDFQNKEDVQLNVSSPAPTELLAAWTFENNETSYFEVMWSPPAEDDTSSATTNTTSYTITALTPCTPYIVSVRAVDFNNQTLGISSNETAITATPVTNVSSVAVDAVANQSSLLDVSWKMHDDLTNCSTNFSVTWTRVDDTTPDEILTTDLDYTIAGLDAFTRYNVCVSTCLSDAFKYPMCGVNMTTEDVPGQPTNVTVKAATSEALWVDWEEPDEPNGVIISYTLIWTHAATRDVQTLQVDGNTTDAILRSLQPCTVYIINVSASTTAGSGQQGGPVIASTEATAPSRPTNVQVSQVVGAPDALAVTWTQASAFGHCRVTSNIITWWVAASGDLIGNETFLATVQVNLSGLQSCTTYSVGVAAAVHGVSGPKAACVNGTTGQESPPPSPRTPPWVVWLSVVAVVLLVVVGGVALYSFRHKLKMFKQRTRPSPSANHSILDLNTRSPPPDQVSAGAVQVEDLRSYIKCLEEDTQRGLEDEFEQVQQNSAKHPTEAATEDLNKGKNRFRNILPFDHSRVILTILVGEPSSDYINANHIKDMRERQPFVACQGPMDSTVRDFWRLVWQLNAGVVVMLTNLRERGRERCALYWPPKEVPIITVGEDLTVTRCGVSRDGGVRVREFLLQKDKHQRPIRQYHLTTWPDFGVPSHEHHLLDFIHEIRNFVSPASGPLVVHCSAGVGRTGTFIGLWNLMEAVDGGSPASVNVQQIVLAMRECRCNMVQSPEQYLYLYKCIAAYLEEPHRWRTKGQSSETSAMPPPQAHKDKMFAYDNPAFSEDSTTS